MKVNNFYIDANGLLHSAAQNIFNYGSNKRKIDPYSSLSYKEKIQKVYELFFGMILSVTEIANPDKILYIAIDGPAPLAKQAQQRQRRFVAALASSVASNNGELKFDSNCITPGTEFMFELTKYLHYRIRKEIQNQNSLFHTLQVYFSPPTVPGEGEHKIMDYMRSLDSKTKTDDTHCMFGPDGDLIMLTLSSHIPKMFLLREDQYTPGYYDVLDMSIIRNGLVHSLGFSKNKERSVDDIVDDFIFIGFFVGNDFLPKLQMFMYLEKGLDLMINLYSSTDKYLLTNTQDISMGFLRLTEELARREKVYLTDQAKNQPADPRFTDTTLLKNMKNDTLDYINYRKDYYIKAGIADPGVIGNPSDTVKSMCVDYIKTIYWVFLYYVVTMPSWQHYYRWHYPPLMTDLSIVLSSFSSDDITKIKTFDIAEPSLPFVQLLSVISPKNITLLPEQYHHLMTSKDSPLVKKGYYPDSFIIDYEGKTKEHMGIALLPFVDVEEIKKAYYSVKSNKKYTKNTFGKLEKFNYDKEYLADYISDYGKILNMRVRKTFN